MREKVDAIDLVMCNILIQQLANHLLVGSAVFLGFCLEKSNALCAQGNRHFFQMILGHKLFWWGQEIGNEFEIADRFVSVLDLLAHKSVFPFASSRYRRCECGLNGM